jgi:hypothetical protein
MEVAIQDGSSKSLSSPGLIYGPGNSFWLTRVINGAPAYKKKIKKYIYTSFKKLRNKIIKLANDVSHRVQILNSKYFTF